MLMRSRVAWAVTAPNYGRTCAPGGVCDLSERLPNGGTLGDIVHQSWFEPVEPEPAESAPARRSRPKQETPDAPVKE
jgi:hypothetical protein